VGDPPAASPPGYFHSDVNYTDAKVMRAFDDKYGTRSYPVPGGASTNVQDAV
jgi:hypothetical protein